MQSYIGVIARKDVKITYPTWKHVPEHLKEKIWKAIILLFNVDPGWKKNCWSSAGSKWRTYKTTLTRVFIKKRMGTPELNKPPGNIDAIVWRDFVIERISDKFQKLSDQHKELAKKNKFPHHLSRKGYARYASENDSLLDEDVEINRCTLWCEARKSKDGEYHGSELKEKTEKIMNFIEDKKTNGSECEIEGGILSQALESGEHSGRVRGVGGHVKPSSYFHLSKTKRSNMTQLCRQHEIELIAQRKKNDELQERLQKIEEQVFKSKEHKSEVEELGSCTEKIQRSIVDGTPGHAFIGVKLVGNDDDVKIVDEEMGLGNDESLKGKSVALTLELRTDIIAYGTIIKVYDPEELIHGKKIPKNCMRVVIEKAMDGSARLPIPTDDCQTVNDAVGSHVDWPMHLMKLHVWSGTKNKKKCETKNPSLDPSIVPKHIYLVYCYCKIKMAASGLIEFPLDNAVFWP